MQTQNEPFQNGQFFNFALKWQNFCQIWSHCCLTNFQNKNSRKSFSHQKCHADSFEWSLLFYFFCQIKNILKFFYTDNASCTTTPLFQLFALDKFYSDSLYFKFHLVFTGYRVDHRWLGRQSWHFVCMQCVWRVTAVKYLFLWVFHLPTQRTLTP